MNRLHLSTSAFTLLLFLATTNLAQIKDSDYKILTYSKTIEKGEDISKDMLDKGEKRIVAQLTLRNGKSTGMHTEDMPFMVYGIAGSGELILGNNEKVISIEPGVFVAVESGIAHDVIAKPDLSIFVIKLVDDSDKQDKHEKHEKHHN